MHCSYVKERMADLFDETISGQQQDEILQHASQCSICAKELDSLNNAAKALSAGIKIKSSESLKQNVMKKIHENSETTKLIKGRIRNLFSPTWQKIAGLAAALLVAFILLPIFGVRFFDSNASARSLLGKSIEALAGIKSVFMKIEVRSVPGDNLDLIDTKGDFISYKLWKVFGNPDKWKIEKPGLTVAMDGRKQYKYMEKAGLGYVGSVEAGFVDWLRIFLTPAQILQTEKDYAREHKARYKVYNTSDETILTVNAKALGDFKNTYLLNSSVAESDNRRVYHFDSETGRLKSAEVFITEAGKEVQVLKVTDIQYDNEIADTTFSVLLPTGVKWFELANIEPTSGNPKITGAGELARVFFNACSRQDWAAVFQLDPTLQQSAKLADFKALMGGLQVISIGKPFKSGLYPGRFVPYTVKYKSGEVHSENLAVRNDNKARVWTLDGGF